MQEHHQKENILKFNQSGNTPEQISAALSIPLEVIKEVLGNERRKLIVHQLKTEEVEQINPDYLLKVKSGAVDETAQVNFYDLVDVAVTATSKSIRESARDKIRNLK
jgi:hypothetical protein